MTAVLKDLQPYEEMQLVGLTAHPGFAVFCKLAEAAINSARDEILQIEPDQHKKICAAQVEARAMAKFYGRLRKEIEKHVFDFGERAQVALEREQAQATAEAMDEEPER